MRKWDPLNAAQLELLKRVGAGADLSAADDSPYRTSAYALSNRGLVTVSKRGGVFRALITDAGQFYLEHGHHPDRPDPVARLRRTSGQPPATTAGSNHDPDAPTSPQPPREFVVGTPAKGANARPVAANAAARDLLDRISASGGVLRFENLDAGTRSAHIKAVTRANSTGLVPSGHHLRHSTRSSGEFVIVLADVAKPDTLSWNPPRRSRAAGAVGVVVATMRDHPTVFDVSEAARPRALEILQTLADEAEARGHRLFVPRRRKRPEPVLNVNSYECELRFVEEKDRVQHTPTADERRRSRRYGWNPAPEFDLVPSGRLRLEAREMYHYEATHHWADTNRTVLEKQIRKIFADLEAKAETRRQEHLARVREEEERRERERREQAVRQAQWEEAMCKARKAAIATFRRRTFATALDDWNTALEIRALCDALEEAATRTPEHHHAERLRQWSAWGHNQADRLDPTTSVGLAHTPFDHEPGPDDLRPHLGEWSPFRAEREHRYEPRARESNQPTPTENWFTRRARQWWRR
ncbi:hypothetical protein ACPA54_03410 [Uniformispora flossi]|uniref:hypothetical protein n=1 Tax=Uniformispora flossi TaxID=3390723 RepID=UPI003C2B2741